jgi:hypothetical protein
MSSSIIPLSQSIFLSQTSTMEILPFNLCSRNISIMALWSLHKRCNIPYISQFHDFDKHHKLWHGSVIYSSLHYCSRRSRVLSIQDSTTVRSGASTQPSKRQTTSVTASTMLEISVLAYLSTVLDYSLARHKVLWMNLLEPLMLP